MSESAIWQAVLGELELTMSKANFETWLRPTKLKTTSEHNAVVEVPNIFIQRRLESHYHDQLLESLQKHAPTLVVLNFRIIRNETAITPPPLELSETKVTVVEQMEESAHTIPPTIVSTQTFQTFVEGTTNRLAYTVSRTVAENPGRLYNPLFIYGGVGLGKTHLMHAIANETLQRNPKAQVLYVGCETFTNDYITAIQTKSMAKFKQKYRTCDVLLVDDIQFIANKEGSQEEFFNTFNTLHQSNRQIVIAADRVPRAIPGLEERLSSRFGWGMVVDIQPPNFETRLAILQSKCLERDVTIPSEALTYVAQQVQSNIRDLEGALNRIIIYCKTEKIPFSAESAKIALSGLMVPNQRRKHSVDIILSLVAEHFGVAVVDIIGARRTKELVYPRHITMFILRDEVDLTFPVIAREMGGRDHTTIMHGYNKIFLEMTKDARIQSDVARIKQRLAAL